MTRDEIRRTLPLQAGALLGPMAGNGIITLIPTLAEAYAVPLAQVALAITAYMVPFAVAQIFSGAVAQVLTGRRTATLGFAVFAAASLGCAAAPTLPVFLLLRFLQGVGAAFLFPILMALVGEVVAPERLGRAIGVFGVTQMIGLTVGPLLAGVFEVHLSWRWFFAALGLLALASGASFIALFRSEGEPEADQGVLAIAVTVLREPAVILLSVAAAWYFFSMIGAFTYLATSLKEAHGLAEDRIGLVLALSGAAGIPASAIAGHWVDRWGRKAVAVAGLAGYVMPLAGLIALPYSFAGVLVLSALLGWSGTVAWIALNTLAVELMPALRKPVASIYNAVRFFGYSLAPPVLGLAYGDGNATLVYAISALVACASAGLILAIRAPSPPHRRDESRAGSLSPSGSGQG